jgi:hypothetical protein
MPNKEFIWSAIIEGIVFCKVNLVNLVAGSWMAWLMAAGSVLKGYNILMLSVSVTLVAIYNGIKAYRLWKEKKED